MVHRCCIPSCGMNVRVPEARGLSYHTFPVKEPQRHKWIAAIIPYMDKPKFKVVQGYTRICSRHFTKKDYSLDSKKRARLSSNAVPSIFPEKGAPLVIENSNAISSELSCSADDMDNDLPTKILKCASDVELNASLLNSNEADAAIECVKEEVIDTSWQQPEIKSEFVEPKDPTRRRKIKKNRISKRKSTSPGRDYRRKISTNSTNSTEELNIEEAFADIKLSKLLSMGPPAATEPRFAIPKDWKADRTGNAFRNQQQLLGSSAGSVDSLCSSTDDNNSATPVSTSLPLASDSFGSLENNVEPELLLSIQAVNLNSLKQENLSGGARTISEQCTSSESESDRLPINPDFEESLLETLTLNDFSLLDRFTDNKLTFDLPSSLLSTENFSTSLLDDVQYNVFSSPLQSPFDFDFNSEDILISEFQNMSAKSDGTEESSPIKKAKPAYQDTTELCRRKLDFQNETVETNEDLVLGKSLDGRISPAGNATKKRKTVRSSFSVERFLQSETDIEYYTGFSSYSKFEAFYNEIQDFWTKSRANNEKEDMKNKVSTTSDTEVQTHSSSKASTLLADIFESISPSQGALSHIDELFITIIRLRRKLPDKILGHMFCITRPAVTRTVRAWTSLLTKILEKSTASTPDAGGNDSSSDDNSKLNVELPPHVHKLLESSLAKSILVNARSLGLSRKTSCTSNHSTSKSKRPKKEKTSHPAEHSSSGPTSPTDNLISQQTPPTKEQVFVIPSTESANKALDVEQIIQEETATEKSNDNESNKQVHGEESASNQPEDGSETSKSENIRK